MYKKSITFFLLTIFSLTTMNIYSLESSTSNGYNQSEFFSEPIGKSTPINPATKALLENCQKRLDALSKEEESQYFHTNCCWAGTGVSALVTAVALYFEHQSLALAGFSLGVFSGGLGLVSINNENYKAQTRAEERKEIYSRISDLQKK